MIIVNFIKLALMILILPNTSIAYGGQHNEISSREFVCPSNCLCQQEELHCFNLPKITDSNLPRAIKSIKLFGSQRCSDQSIYQLLKLAKIMKWKVHGFCHWPNQQTQYSLQDLSYDQLFNIRIKKERRRYRQRRSITSHDSSVYQFEVKPKVFVNCTFDQDNCNWNQLESIDFLDWKRHQSNTLYNGTGPIYDHTSKNSFGYYMYINSSSLEIQNQYADLISPPLLSPGYGNDINITFYYHAYGASSGKLYVYAMYPKYSASLYLLEKISLIARNSWLKASIQFKTNYSDYRIIIRGVVGSKVGSSIAIDDVFIQALENNCFSHEGQHYRGTIAVTSDGYTCKNWNSDSIISVSLALLNHSIEHDLSSNYCRNPFRNRLKPWCYIESNLTKLSWQYCNVPTCNFSKITVTTYPLGNKYPIKIVQKDGQDKLIGRLAIYYNGRWGSICLKGMTANIASVFCRQAEYGNQGSIITVLNQTKTTGTIWLRGYDIKCPSYSTDLTQCILGPWNASRCCNHSEDVWIKCSQSNLIGHQPSKAFSNDSYNHSTATIDTIVYRANNEDTYVIGIALGCVIIGIAIIAWLLRYYIKCNQRVSASGGAVQWSANNLTVATATSSVINRPTTTNSSDAELRTMYASSITGVITPISSSNRIASSDASYHALNRSCANHRPQHSHSIQAFQDSSSRSNARFAAPYQPHYDRKMSRMTDVVSLPPSYDAVMKMKFQQRKGRQGNGTTST